MVEGYWQAGRFRSRHGKHGNDMGVDCARLICSGRIHVHYGHCYGEHEARRRNTCIWCDGRSLLWLGFVAPTYLVNKLFAGHGLKVWAIEVGNHLVNFILFGAILGAWR